MAESHFREGFEEEALPHLEAVYRFALRLTAGQSAAAEDLVQETFLRALRSWVTYRRGTNCRSWLFTITRNAFLRRTEHQDRRPDVAEADVGVEVTALAARSLFSDGTGADPERTFFDSFVDARVLRALDRLPLAFREAVTLSDLEGMSYGEVAEVLHLPVGTVKSRLHRGRRILQRELRDYALETGFLAAA